MKKYLLTVIGEITNESTCRHIAVSLSPIVDSPNMKFQYTKGVLLFHFASEIPHNELYDFIQGSLYGIVNVFILSEYNDKMSVFMPQDIKNHLFDLDNDNDTVQMRITLDNIDEDIEDDDEEDYVALLLEEVKRKVKRPSLDQLLDKIKTKGIGSLSPFEKETLESYSK